MNTPSEYFTLYPCAGHSRTITGRKSRTPSFIFHLYMRWICSA